MSRIIIVLLELLLLTLVGCDKPVPPQTRTQINQNTQAPDFALLDMNNQEVKLADLIGPKPLVLDFWAAWCPVCRSEIPNVVDLHNTYKDKITIVGISLDQSYADAQAYTQKHNIPYPNLYDARGMVAQTYQIAGIPALIIINAKGEIVKRNATIEDVKALAK